MWKELIAREMETTYHATEGLMDLVDDDKLDWKPSEHNNWLTTGQLLSHITDACGSGMRGVLRDDWRMPEEMKSDKVDPETKMPTAEAYTSVESLEETKRLLAEDKILSREILDECDEEALASEKKSVPWDKTETLLGYRVLEMIEHLKTHKAQLFYYLKLQGKHVHTGHLWGM
ncbi:MAG: DinB family protein [Candidatus Sumerlaeota bacterium]